MKPYSAPLVFVLTILFTGLLVQGGSATHEGKLHYRPCEVLYDTPEDIPVPMNWTEDFDGGDNVGYCLTDQNDTDVLGTGFFGNDTIFIQQEVFFDPWSGESHKQVNADFHLTNVSYEQSKPIGSPTNGVYVEFDYYIPSGDISQDGTSDEVCYEDVEQFVLIGNEEANFSEGSGTFDDAFYELNDTESACDQWHHFRHHANDFTNDFGSAFSHSSKTIGAFSLEVGNMYVKNLTFVGMDGVKRHRVW